MNTIKNFALLVAIGILFGMFGGLKVVETMMGWGMLGTIALVAIVGLVIVAVIGGLRINQSVIGHNNEVTFINHGQQRDLPPGRGRTIRDDRSQRRLQRHTQRLNEEGDNK